ncbi:MAG: glutamine--tRNA ligase/YqeY domain fusion protein [Acholeplasmatales bacterium]|nr:glutamine--tRNA ligase/YqeY domain fusion protein [Acholeplasmatales bacterium]
MSEINNFIKTIMKDDLESGKVNEIITRFPPEPNAYLHIGHARAIITNFELAKAFNGKTNLRFDDTNPAKEDKEFVEGIIEDLAWLGYKPNNIFYGSDYFEKTYEKAIMLIKKGLAYVDDLSQEEISKYRGTLNEPGKNSPYRDRSVEENLRLFEEMRQGKYKDGEKTLRAKIDMSSPNINMRDPVMYRILHINHHRQGTKWCIFPMYDFAHPLQDSFEKITHSLCSLEYDNHRVLYDWVVDNCEIEKEYGRRPYQTEFGRLNITNTIMSKRYLRALVDSNYVDGYDDPRMPTLCGLRRRGYTPDSIREFILGTGLSRINSTVTEGELEEALRNDLKLKAKRPYAVIDPIKVIIDNYPEGQVEWLDCPDNQEDENAGSHKIAFSRELYIEREDFIEQKPNKKWKRLALDVEVRLMHAYFIKAVSCEKDENGNITLIHATYDPLTKSNSGFNERKPNGNIHFVEATTAIPAEFRLFEPLLIETEENKDLDFMEKLNPNSKTIKNGYVVSALKDTKEGEHFQFVRNGYYVTDKDSTDKKLVFNRTCSLKSSFSL